ncbi:MAG: hypothetical protein ABI658_14200 [Acidimicrobiales bacterium]
MDRQDSPYRRGNLYTAMPIPMVPEMCTPVDAGPVRLIVESRQLTNAILADTYQDEEIPDGHVEFDDYGPTVHVCGTADGLEHIRFDCFEHEPHYHYIRNHEHSNVVVRIDEVAVGDPVEFTLRCLRTQLPEMLELAGATELGRQARDARDDVLAAVDKVGELMARAR